MVRWTASGAHAYERACGLQPVEEEVYVRAPGTCGRLVYYAGHDINLYFLRTLLRLHWLTSSWNADESMPGGGTP